MELQTQNQVSNLTQVSANTIKLDQTKLKRITNASNTSIVTMLYLALRQRDRDFLNVTATKDQLIRMGEKIVDEEYIDFWRSLEGQGFGNFISGRRGNPDRFKPNYSLKTIARVAIEGRDQEVQELAKKKEVVVKPAPKLVAKRGRGRPKKEAKRPVGRPRKAGLALVTRTLLTVALKSGSVAEVILPKNASAADIKKVCRALSR